MTLLLALLLALPADHGAHAGPMPLAPRDSTAYWAFVDLLATAWTPVSIEGGYEPRRAGRWDNVQVMSHVASAGITFYDVNSDSTWHVSCRALNSELRARRGPSYAMLLHLGYIRAQPYAQYSSLRAAAKADTTVVHVATWYEVSLVLQAGQLKVVKVAYLKLEGE